MEYSLENIKFKEHIEKDLTLNFYKTFLYGCLFK